MIHLLGLFTNTFQCSDTYNTLSVFFYNCEDEIYIVQLKSLK